MPKRFKNPMVSSMVVTWHLPIWIVQSLARFFRILRSKTLWISNTFRANKSTKKGSDKVLSLLEGCLDLISSPSSSLKSQIKGGKLVWNSNVQCFIWFLNNKTRYKKMVKIKDTQFCMENLKMKRKKGQNFVDLPEWGFKPQIF